ncbi:MAG TPA: hypothetical protein VF006_32325 [Longimicrobium sp.]
MKAVLLAALAGAAAGACARGGEIAAPDGAGPRMDGGAAPQDPSGASTATDSSGRWGGYIGGGG